MRLAVAVALLVGPFVSGSLPAASFAAPPTVVSVKDFGAKGDGVTDDSRAIQLALRAGTAPRTVVFPAGDYVFADVVVGNDTAVVFESGAGGSGPTRATSGNVFFSVLGSASAPVRNVRFSGGAFRGRPAMGGVIVAKYAQGLQVSGVQSSDVGKNVSTNLSSDVAVHDCSASRARWGFAFEASERIEVTGCRTKETLRDGILFYGRSRACTASQNVVEDYMTGGDVGVGGIQAYGSTETTIVGNAVMDGHYDSAGIRFRDAESFWCADNYVVSPGSSGLQVVRVGDYAGLDGGDGAFVGNTVERPHLFGIDVSNSLCKPVRVIGNVILDVASSSTVSAATGIVVIPHGSSIIGNRVEVATGPGIQTGGSSNVTAWNRIHETASVNFGPRVGLFVSGGTGQAVVANEIRDLARSMSNGLRLYPGTSALIRDNAVRGATQAPLDIRGTQLPILAGDSTPPEVAVSVVSTMPGGAVVGVSAADSRSPVTALRVSIDAAPPEFFSGPRADIRVSGEGSHSVSASAIDAAGNASSSASRSVDVPTGPTDQKPTAIDAFLAGGRPGGASPPKGSVVTLLGSLRDSTGALLESTATPRLQRFLNGGWIDQATAETGSDGSLSYRGTLDGLYRFCFPGDASSAAAVSATIPITPIDYRAVEGSDRISTAIAASREAFARGAATVVVCTGYGFPDALAASGLAGAFRGPLLLTVPSFLPRSVADEVVRLHAKKAIIVGGERVVTRSVATRLEGLLGRDSVTRIGGGDRYETAGMCASAAVDELKRAGRAFDGTVFIATGVNFPDALAASPIAAANGWPILLTSTSLPESTARTVTRIGAKRAYVLGGTNAVSEGVESRLRSGLGTGAVSRLKGSSRYDTAKVIAGFGVSSGLKWDGAAIATGDDFPDALAGGAMQGSLRSVMLLTPQKSLDPSTRGALVGNRGKFTVVRYLGGPAALAQHTRDAVSGLLW